MSYRPNQPMRMLLSAALVSPALLASSAQAADPEVSPYAGAPGWKETKEERTKWFKDAKFGMFIHWGLYSPAGGYWPPNPKTGKKYPQHYSEWLRYWGDIAEPEYGKLTKPLFKPDKGCTDEWAKLAKEAGMKYTVLTTKHHDGYTLFNAKAPYSVSNTITGSTNISPKGRDMVAEYAKSVRKEGLKVGYYYSIIDWQHPHATMNSRKWPITADANHDIYVDYMHSHMKQLFSDYGKSDIIWVDYSTPQHQGKTWRSKQLLTDLHKLQPHSLTNNRFWNGLQNPYGDFFTPEKYIPASGYPGRTFEVCHTMNESFGYSHHDKKWKSTKDVVHMLVDIVSKGGNLLLNVGPDGKGHIPAESARVLRETGEWLKVHGDAVYGTKGSPVGKLIFNGRCTAKALNDGTTNLYFHILDWPADGKLTLPSIKNEIKSVSLLGSEQKLSLPTADGGLTLILPKLAPNKLCSVVKINIKGTPVVDNASALVQQKADRSVLVKAFNAEVKGSQIKIAQASGSNPTHVSHWVDANQTASFSFNVNSPGPVQAGGAVKHKPGKYAVYLNYAADKNAGGSLKLTTVNNQQVEFDMKPTGSWNSYKRQKVGEITLTKMGETKIKLEALKVNSTGFMNIKSLELKPIN